MLALRWAALAEAGAVSAMLAQVEDDTAHFPLNAALAALTGWRGQMVEERLAQLSVTMETGLGALLAMRETGADPRSPARALWHEFAEEREAIKALLEAG